MLSVKSIIFFSVIFGIIIYGYFNYEIFSQYFPVSVLIKLFILILGLAGIFFPQIIRKLRDGEEYDNIKDFIIEKYKKKSAS